MKRLLMILMLMLMSAIGVGSEQRNFERPIPESQWNDTTKLWLARSCVGEAGFVAYEECIGIAWVYASRWKASSRGTTLEDVIRGYSAAVKRRSTLRRKWILDLRLDGERPKRWPNRLRWSGHKPFWETMLKELDQWALGYRANPVKGANHFGGKMDTPRKSWVIIKPTSSVAFGNVFYRSPKAVIAIND
jgi:hypothetical protein